jgi:hypothetical protein
MCGGCQKDPVGPTATPAVLAPLAGSKYLAGRDTIEVRYTPLSSSAIILFSFRVPRDTVWDTIQSPVRVNDSTVRFVAPARRMSDTAAVRVVGIGSGSSPVESAPFSVKRLLLTSPVGGEQWNVGDTIHVRWDVPTVTGNAGTNVAAVDIELSVDGGVEFVNQNSKSIFPDDSLGRWGNFPVVVTTATTQGVIKIRDYFYAGLNDRNVVPFTVH